jgi:Exocyst complex component Sec5
LLLPICDASLVILSSHIKPLSLLSLLLLGKTENQVEQLENLVRDNFPLFVRCAEGFDEFQNSETEVGMGVNERIDKLEGIAESCAYQAKKSFSPLLDNTREVRKVQSAMAVLQRVAPILQAPAMMRQHLENRRYSEALKTYRRVLVVDESCKIELLLRVKANAQECVREARRDLERRLSKDKVSVDDLLDGIRDLGELLELDVPLAKKKSYDGNESPEEEGVYDIGGTVVKTRDHPPALACLLLQAAHFSYGVKTVILEADETCQRIFSGEPLSQVQSDVGMNHDASGDGGVSVISSAVEMPDDRATVGAGNQWKYDILDARVISTIQAVGMARAWLGRLVRVGLAAREDEKRRAARIGGASRRKLLNPTAPDNNLTAFEVFISNVTPSLQKLIEHAAFCALGSNTARRDGKDIVMTFGQTVTEKLRAILKSPLPPTQSTKVGKALADLATILSQNMDGANSLRPDLNNEMSMFHLSPLEACKTLSDAAVVTIEKRRCIYAFDVCARAGANRASGSGKFDADALLHCLQNLADDLACPEACAAEIEKGVELVVRRCCEGLASYVRDRGDSARLAAVAECADVVADRIAEIVDEVSALLNADANRLEGIMLEDIVGLESAMFDEYLENIRQGVVGSTRIGWLDVEQEQQELETHATASSSFPAYLSASLLAIVRCRAQVEQALGDTIRDSENVSYEHLALATVSEGVVEGICNEVMVRKPQLKVRQADKLANELEFLRNTLKRFLPPDTLSIMESTLNMVNSKAGRGRNFKGDGPDGLAALEELERLGRVYVLCLGD